MPRINNKIEVLRSLERTKEQFEVQYRENCDGTENGAYPEFSNADLFPLAPALSKTAAILAACPIHIVHTSGLI